MTFFHAEDVLKVMQENWNPEYFYYNLSVVNRSKDSDDDYTSSIVAWAEIFVVLILVIMLIKVIR